jgi:ankyrin repeat protein
VNLNNYYLIKDSMRNKILAFSFLLLISLQSMYSMEQNQTIYSAACDGNMHLLTHLLAQGADNNALDYQNLTALHYAAIWGHLNAVEYLIRNGAHINTQGTYGLESGWTALHHAALRLDLKIAQCLLLNGADINAQTANGKTALHKAAKSGYLKMVRCLINHGADITIKATNGETAFDVATRRGYKRIATLLQKYSQLAEELKKTTLRSDIFAKVIESKLVSLAKILLQRGIIPTQENIYFAYEHNSTEVRYLIEEYLRLSKIIFGVAKHNNIKLPQEIVNLIAFYAL